MDGVFNIIHSGHFNANCQGKKLGDILIVGVNLMKTWKNQKAQLL